MLPPPSPLPNPGARTTSPTGARSRPSPETWIQAIPDAPLLGTPSTITSSLTLDPHVGFVEFMEIEIELT